MSTIILGGPGCGKTTELLRIIDNCLADGVDPSRIAFLTFTRKAAREAIDRACQKFNFERDEIPYFRTIHSFAFKMLGITPDRVMSDDLHKQFGQWGGYDLSQKTEENLGIVTTTHDDRIMTALSMSRLTRTPLADVCMGFEVEERIAKGMRDAYAEFKYERGVLDFTDMLEMYLDRGTIPALDVLIVDEAQDLSALQWAIVDKLTTSAGEVYYAGDDDQAIYAWAGADVERFLSLDGKKQVLPVSYRLTQGVFDAAQSLVTQITARYAKDWRPHASGGAVEYVRDIHDCDLTDGSWYLLARNAYLLAGWKAHLYANGYPFIDGDRSTIDNEEVEAILGWEHLRRGELLPGYKVQVVWEHLRPAHIKKEFRAHTFESRENYTLESLEMIGLTTTDDWREVIDIAPHKKKYYAEIKHKGFSLVKEPGITVSTIHGVKGGEADNVLICPDMSRKTFTHLQREPEAELRVFYVAASRARTKLLIQEPKTPEHFKFQGAN